MAKGEHFFFVSICLFSGEAASKWIRFHFGSMEIFFKSPYLPVPQGAPNKIVLTCVSAKAHSSVFSPHRLLPGDLVKFFQVEVLCIDKRYYFLPG